MCLSSSYAYYDVLHCFHNHNRMKTESIKTFLKFSSWGKKKKRDVTVSSHNEETHLLQIYLLLKVYSEQVLLQDWHFILTF